VSFKTIGLPFFEVSKYHQIFNCYYFQLNHEELKPMQYVINSFYKNLDRIQYLTSEKDFAPGTVWVKSNGNYYLNTVMNYTQECVQTEQIKYYDITSGNSNTNNYIDINKQFVSELNLEAFSVERTNKKCEKMKMAYEKELISNKQYSEIVTRNNRMKLSLLLNKINLLDEYLDNNSRVSLSDDVLTNDINDEYEAFSEYYSSDNETVVSCGTEAHRMGKSIGVQAISEFDFEPINTQSSIDLDNEQIIYEEVYDISSDFIEDIKKSKLNSSRSTSSISINFNIKEKEVETPSIDKSETNSIKMEQLKNEDIENNNLISDINEHIDDDILSVSESSKLIVKNLVQQFEAKTSPTPSPKTPKSILKTIKDNRDENYDVNHKRENKFD